MTTYPTLQKNNMKLNMGTAVCDDLSIMLQGNNQEYFRPPMVRVDPERRCSVMLIYGTHLVVLPFRQEGVLDEQDIAFTGRYLLIMVH